MLLKSRTKKDYIFYGFESLTSLEPLWKATHPSQNTHAPKNKSATKIKVQ